MNSEQSSAVPAKYVWLFAEIDKFSLDTVGGKGANLGELVKAGFCVPDGFCLDVSAYNDFITTSNEMAELFVELEKVTIEQLAEVSELGERIRTHLNTLAIPPDIETQVLEAWHSRGEDMAYAVRSSATAEDLPTASFAGQQDTYLNVIGREDLLRCIRSCWASLFTDRAIIYRTNNGFDQRNVALSVVVQRMILSDVSGTMFTADPVTGNRKTISIDASFGLGEALVAGIVTPDLYQVKQGQIVKKQISKKEIAIYANAGTGTNRQELALEQQTLQALTDQQIIELASIGEQIEKHYVVPQDIEWAVSGGKIYIVQSRPITSLYPFPADLLARDLEALISFGHPQMMTEALRPLAISVLRTLLPIGKENSVRAEGDALLAAGGRLYINYSPLLRFKKVREKAPVAFRGIDALIGSALAELIRRNPALQSAKASRQSKKTALRYLAPVALNLFKNLFFRDPTKALDRTNRFIDELVEEYEVRLAQTSGAERIRVIQESAGTLMMAIIKGFAHYFFSGMLASGLISNLSKKWLGDNEAIAELNKSLYGNVTTEMGLCMGDLADLARNHPGLVKFLETAQDETFYEELRQVEGADEFREALAEFMQKYGMRCPGEIDLTRPRWRDTPTQMVAIILGNVQNLRPGEHRIKFAEGEREAEQAGGLLLRRLRQTRGGWAKAKIVARFIRVYRHLMGIREHPKYSLIRHFGLYRQAILAEGRLLVASGILQEPEDVFYLALPELLAILEQTFIGNVRALVALRKEEYQYYQRLTPPRVMTGEGEVIPGSLHLDNAPAGALIGNPVSAGVVEGRARIVLSPGQARLKKGDIMVAPFTDPGWTPLFLSIGGLVIETGGLMTHGAVVAREYGIPAVVGIEDATKIIKDGQFIRVNGSRGYVEILDQVQD